MIKRLDMARRPDAGRAMAFSQENPLEAIRHRIDGRGLDAATLRVLRPGGTLCSLGVCSLGVCSSGLRIPLNGLAAGLGGHRIVTTLCLGEKGTGAAVAGGDRQGLDLEPLVIHHCPPDRSEEACDLFSRRRDGVLKVATTP